MGTPKNGTNIVLLVNTGTPSVPSYEAVGYQRDVTFDEATAEIDVSSKESRAKRVLAGRYSGSISLDALYIDDDDGYLALQTAMRNGDLILVANQEDDVTIETATALITSMSKRAPDQGESTISISLVLDGEWATVGS
jgi:TP901-1 family phage major tail protein